MLSVIYAKCFNIGLYAECHYAECCYAECHGAACSTAVFIRIGKSFYSTDGQLFWKCQFSLFFNFLCGSSVAGRTIDKQSRVLGFESILSWKGLTLCYLRGLKRVELWAKSEFWKHLLLLRIKRSFKPKLTLIKLCKHTCNKLECLPHVYTLLA